MVTSSGLMASESEGASEAGKVRPSIIPYKRAFGAHIPRFTPKYTSTYQAYYINLTEF